MPRSTESPAANTLPGAGTTLLHRVSRQGYLRFQHARQALLDDWRGKRVVSFGLLLFVVTTLVVLGYYINHPAPETDPDTPSYLHVTQNILDHGQLVDPARTPGFPLFIALFFLLAGRGNLMAVSVAQAVLFVLATLEIYLITWIIALRAWIALVAGLMVGCNIYLLAFTKPVIAEGFALWLVVSLALACLWFMQALRVGRFWLVVALVLVLFMSQPSWVYVPVPLLAYLLVMAWRKGQLRRFLPHAVVALVVLYAILGLFIYANATEYGYPGITIVQRINLLGKVIQYHMQNEAPPQYAALAQKVDAYVTQGGDSPYGFDSQDNEVSQNHWLLAGEYSNAIVQSHPIEFALHTIPVLFTSSDFYYTFSQIDGGRPFGFLLLRLQNLSADVYLTYRLFPFLALGWFGALLWRRTTRLRRVEEMGVVAFLGFYGLLLVAVGGYSDYTRLHIPFDPLMLVVIWGSVLLGLARIWPRVKNPVMQGLDVFWRRAWLVWGVGVLGGVALNMAWAALRHGSNSALDPSSWAVVHAVELHPRWGFYAVVLAAGAIVAAWRSHRALLIRAALQGQAASIPSEEQPDTLPELLPVEEPSPD